VCVLICRRARAQRSRDHRRSNYYYYHNHLHARRFRKLKSWFVCQIKGTNVTFSLENRKSVSNDESSRRVDFQTNSTVCRYAYECSWEYNRNAISIVLITRLLCGPLMCIDIIKNIFSFEYMINSLCSFCFFFATNLFSHLLRYYNILDDW